MSYSEHFNGSEHQKIFSEWRTKDLFTKRNFIFKWIKWTDIYSMFIYCYHCHYMGFQFSSLAFISHFSINKWLLLIYNHSCVFTVVKRTNDPYMDRDFRKHTFAYAELLLFWKYHAVQFYFGLRLCFYNGIWTWVQHFTFCPKLVGILSQRLLLEQHPSPFFSFPSYHLCILNIFTHHKLA
jgi:hypothetical protein